MQTAMSRDDIIRREALVYHGWNIAADDDTPRPPEPDCLASAQARRAHRLHHTLPAVITSP